jgi:hypothetical protein
VSVFLIRSKGKIISRTATVARLSAILHPKQRGKQKKKKKERQKNQSTESGKKKRRKKRRRRQRKTTSTDLLEFPLSGKD